jgi:two-component system, cell cycle response regulator
MDNSFKILIADDSAVYRKLLMQHAPLLAPASVLVAKSVREALELFEQERPSLIFADWVMPDATGIELCQRIRAAARTSYTYIIILTSKSDKKDLVRALSSGADDYLTKPFDPDELLARARVGLRLIDLHRQIETQNRLLQELALTDPLTNLPNRRAVVNWAERQLGGSARHKFPLWMVLMDLDHFKSVNDNYGHVAGDAVLKRFGEILLTSTRCCDICGRMGGEEFLQVVTHSDEEGIRTYAERLRNQFAAEKFRFGGSCVTVTASLGVAGFTGGERPPEFSEILRRADAALYRAKKMGRNRVQVETGEHEPAAIA